MKIKSIRQRNFLKRRMVIIIYLFIKIVDLAFRKLEERPVFHCALQRRQSGAISSFEILESQEVAE